MTAQVINLREYRLRKQSKEYARIYVMEGPRMAQYYARQNMNAHDREDCHGLIVREIKRLRRNGKDKES